MIAGMGDDTIECERGKVAGGVSVIGRGCGATWWYVVAGMTHAKGKLALFYFVVTVACLFLKIFVVSHVSRMYLARWFRTWRETWREIGHRGVP